MMLHDWRPTFALALLSLPSLASAGWRQQHFDNEPARASADCIDSASATEINHILRTGGEGTSIVLCPYAHVVIDPHGSPITFTAARQSIYTQGSPEDHTRATITIENDKGHYSGDLTTAVRADCDRCRGVQIRNLHIDGGRVELGGTEGGDALIIVGGAQGEQEVRAVDAWGARGYAILHADGSSFAALLYGDSLTSAIEQRDPWAPAPTSPSPKTPSTPPATLPSTSCSTRSSFVCAMERLPTAVSSAQDSGPMASVLLVLNRALLSVLSLAPSSFSPRLEQNRLGEHHSRRLGSRHHASWRPWLADHSEHYRRPRPRHARRYLHCRSSCLHQASRSRRRSHRSVRSPALLFCRPKLTLLYNSENRIHAASAMIRVGIATGAGVWSTDELIGDHEIAFGSEIIKNRLSSYTGYFAYAIAISDARGIVVNGNAISFVSSYSLPLFAR